MSWSAWWSVSPLNSWPNRNSVGFWPGRPPDPQEKDWDQTRWVDGPYQYFGWEKSDTCRDLSVINMIKVKICLWLKSCSDIIWDNLKLELLPHCCSSQISGHLHACLCRLIFWCKQWKASLKKVLRFQWPLALENCKSVRVGVEVDVRSSFTEIPWRCSHFHKNEICTDLKKPPGIKMNMWLLEMQNTAGIMLMKNWT